MIREGSPDVTLDFLASHRNMLAISSFTDGTFSVCDLLRTIDMWLSLYRQCYGDRANKAWQSSNPGPKHSSLRKLSV